MKNLVCYLSIFTLFVHIQLLFAKNGQKNNNICFHFWRLHIMHIKLLIDFCNKPYIQLVSSITFEVLVWSSIIFCPNIFKYKNVRNRQIPLYKHYLFSCSSPSNISFSLSTNASRIQLKSSVNSTITAVRLTASSVDNLAMTVKQHLLRVNVKIRQNSCPFHILWKPPMWLWFFFFTQYYWSYLIRLADKTEKYWCVNIFFIGLKPQFLPFLPVQQKKLKFRQELLKKLLFSQEF